MRRRPYLRGRHTYNRARIAAVLGEHAEAVRLLAAAHEQGEWLDIQVHADPDLGLPGNYPPFEALMKPKG